MNFLFRILLVLIFFLGLTIFFFPVAKKLFINSMSPVFIAGLLLFHFIFRTVEFTSENIFFLFSTK